MILPLLTPIRPQAGYHAAVIRGVLLPGDFQISEVAPCQEAFIIRERDAGVGPMLVHIAKPIYIREADHAIHDEQHLLLGRSCRISQLTFM